MFLRIKPHGLHLVGNFCKLSVIFLIQHPIQSTVFSECWLRLEIEITSLKVPVTNFLEEKDKDGRRSVINTGEVGKRFLERPNTRGWEEAVRMDKKERSNREELAMGREGKGWGCGKGESAGMSWGDCIPWLALRVRDYNWPCEGTEEVVSDWEGMWPAWVLICLFVDVLILRLVWMAFCCRVKKTKQDPWPSVLKEITESDLKASQINATMVVSTNQERNVVHERIFWREFAVSGKSEKVFLRKWWLRFLWIKRLTGKACRVELGRLSCRTIGMKDVHCELGAPWKS